MKNNNVTLSTNEFDIEMVEIKGEKYSTFISLKKALAILATNDDSTLITEVVKHGRTLFNIKYPTGKGFNIGQKKIEAVLDNESGILLALHADIDLNKQVKEA